MSRSQLRFLGSNFISIPTRFVAIFVHCVTWVVRQGEILGGFRLPMEDEMLWLLGIIYIIHCFGGIGCKRGFYVGCLVLDSKLFD